MVDKHWKDNNKIIINLLIQRDIFEIVGILVNIWKLYLQYLTFYLIAQQDLTEISERIIF